jgi:hypothetical protein
MSPQPTGAALAEMTARATDLAGRYCDAVLRADPVRFGRTWSAEAEWVVPGRVVSGREEIVERFTAMVPAFVLCVQELLSGTVRPVDDRRAEATWQVRELQWRADGTQRELLGVYDDELVVGADGVARFARRTFELVYDGPVELPGRVHVRRGPSG